MRDVCCQLIAPVSILKSLSNSNKTIFSIQHEHVSLQTKNINNVVRHVHYLVTATILQQRSKVDVQRMFVSRDVFVSRATSEMLLVYVFFPHAVLDQSLFDRRKCRKKVFNKVVDSSQQKERKKNLVEFINYRNRGENY